MFTSNFESKRFAEKKVFFSFSSALLCLLLGHTFGYELGFCHFKHFVYTRQEEKPSEKSPESTLWEVLYLLDLDLSALQSFLSPGSCLDVLSF
jgi:hypothetical protein